MKIMMEGMMIVKLWIRLTDGEGGYRNDGQDGGKDDVVGVGDVEWLILCCLLSCGVMVMDKH